MSIKDQLSNFRIFCDCRNGRPINPFNGSIANLQNCRNWGFPKDLKTEEFGIMLGYSSDSIGETFPICMVSVDGEELKNELTESLDTYMQERDGKSEFLCFLDDDDVEIIQRGIDHTTEAQDGHITIEEKCYFLPIVDTNNGKEIKNQTNVLKFLFDRYYDKTVCVFKEADQVITDDDAIKEASKQSRFADAFAGMWKDYFSTKKEAEEYVIKSLAFYTDGNKFQMDRIFRQSGLFDDQWDAPTSTGKLYGERMVTMAAVAQRMGGKVFQMPQKKSSIAYAIDLDVKNEAGLYDSLEAPTETVRYDCSDTGNAHRLYDKFGKILHYSEKNRKWFIYNHSEGRWIENDGILVKTMADQIVEDLKEEAQYKESPKAQEDAFKFAMRSSSHKSKEAFIQEAKHLGSIPIESREDFEKDDMLFNVKNGTIDLTTGKLLHHDPEYMCSHFSPIEYNPEETRQPENFLKYFKEWLPDDDVRNYVHKMLGYTLTGMTTEQSLFFLLGIGNDGKSTMMQLITEIMGDYACNAQPDTFMVKTFKNSSGPSSDLARLSGKRLVYAEEATEGCKLDEGLVKQLTGSSQITARFMRENEYTFTPRFKIWMPTNYKPVIRGTDKGIWRRIRLISFPNSIKDENVDKMLVYKLREEYPLILKWLVEGCIEWYKQDMATGAIMPGTMQEDVKQYKNDMDIIRSFVSDCMIIAPKDDETASNKISIALMYQMYTGWAREGNEFQMARRKFTKEVKNFCDHMGIEYHQGTGNQTWCYGLYQTEDANRYAR